MQANADMPKGQPFTVHGLKELQDALTKLPKELVSNNGGPVRAALMAATAPIVRTAQLTVPDRDKVSGSGLLAKSVSRRRSNRARKGTEIIQIFIRGNKKQRTGAFYAAWVEFGALGLEPTRWLTEAMRSNAESSVNIFRTRLAGSIARIAKKIGAENIRQVAAQVKKL